MQGTSVSGDNQHGRGGGGRHGASPSSHQRGSGVSENSQDEGCCPNHAEAMHWPHKPQPTSEDKACL